MRKVRLIPMSCCFVLLGVGALMFSPPVTTKYASGYSPDAFRSLRPGMTYSEITNIMGLPLSFTVIGQPDTNSHYAPPDMKQLDAIPDYIGRRDDALIMLRYSEKRVDLVYETVEVFLAHGQLTTARRHLGWDD